MTEAWDLLIVDQMLPQMDGVEVVISWRGAGALRPFYF